MHTLPFLWNHAFAGSINILILAFHYLLKYISFNSKLSSLEWDFPSLHIFYLDL